MSTITREQAKRLRNDFECWQQDYDPKDDKEQYDMFGRAMAAMDMLIAGMYQEPVAWIVHARTGDQLTTDGDYVANAEGILGLHSTPLYMTPQQAPVVVDEIAEQAGIDPDIADAYMQGVNDTNQRKLADIIPSAIPEGLTGQIVYICAFDNMPRHELATRIWNACRDAIVHTELSVRSDCPWCDGEGYVEIDHGFEMGVEQKECRHCRAAMLQNGNSPAQSDCCPAQKCISPAQDGNSPVIPDGVCPCCGRKQLKNRTCSVSGCDGKHVARGFCIKHYAIERKKDPSRRESIRAADKRYRARKAAAPQQEGK